MIVAIGPGHGGDNVGALDGYENRINLDVGLIATDVLRSACYQVRLTRDAEKTVHWHKRKLICDTTDLVLSIHHNASPDPERHGMELYHWPGNRDVTTPCMSALSTLPNQFGGGSVIAADHDYPGARNICGYYSPPTVVVECCYLTNTVDFWLTKQHYYSKMSAAFILNLVAAFEVYNA